MLISNISFDSDAQLFETLRKKSSITAPGAHILLGFYDAWSFETPRINDHSVTAPSLLIILGLVVNNPLKVLKIKSRCH